MLKLIILPVLVFLAHFGFSQNADSLNLRDSAVLTVQDIRNIPPEADSLQSADSVVESAKSGNLQELLRENYLIKDPGTAASFPAVQRKKGGDEFDFYYLVALFAFAGILRAVYSRYFANMFRVFFNTSLRQGQLTDQLLQAKLSSMLFNLFFVFSTGFFIYQFLQFSGVIAETVNYCVLLLITAALTVMYSGKFIVLKFTGWVSGFSKEAETYIFIVFLVNKILGILLLPFSLVLAFSSSKISTVVAVISLMVVLVLFLLRFFRSYGILQHRVQVNRFHFFLYIIGVEILPLLLIYKASVDLLLNNA